MRGLGFARTKIDLARLRLHDAARITKWCSIGGQRIAAEVTNPRELSRIRAYVTKEPETVRWIVEYVKPGEVFYDVGANIGLYSIFVAKRLNGGTQVYSFEPESQNYASLNRNVYLNGLSECVTTLCLALSDTSCMNRFYVRGHLRAGEAIHQFGHATDDTGIPFSPVHQQGMIGISLDDLCFVYGLDFPIHIKIDVDGQEAAVIKGAGRVITDPRLQSVLLEVTETPSRMGDIKEIHARFDAAGFSVHSKAPTAASRADSYNLIFARSTP